MRETSGLVHYWPDNDTMLYYVQIWETLTQCFLFMTVFYQRECHLIICFIVTLTGKKFCVADHDFTKCGMIPSLTLLCDIYPLILRSLFILASSGLKDPIFEPSSALRHAAELRNIIGARNVDHPVLVLYSDGGPDHNDTFLKTHAVGFDWPLFEPQFGYACSSMLQKIPVKGLTAF